MKSAFRFAVLALVLIIVAMISGLTAMRLAIHGQEVAIPPLVGLTPTEAERTVANLGLQMSIERHYYSPQIPEGKIMSQLPQPGTKVRRGWQIRVAQSLGPTRVAIPDVTGQSEHAAELNIRRRGLDISSMAEVEAAGIPPDQVLAQDPMANATQLAAPKISLLVTAQAVAQPFVMPNFLGQPLGSANRTLQDAGFRLGNVTVAAPAVAPAPDQANPAGASTTAAPAPPVQAAPPAQAVPPAPSPAPPGATAAPPVQVTPASVIVSQWPLAGQKIAAGAAVSFEVR